ncbi:MAG: RsmB/NOP family class I SAM-dependent RNA methyltransferase [Paracoccaceae bacterium]
MTPPARHQAAIECLDAILGGARPDAALRDWGRAHRFAGSGDRRAIRDIVWDGLRNLRSAAVAGGGGDAPTGRAVVLGLLRLAGRDPAEVFGAGAHAPAPVQAAQVRAAPTDAQAADLPDWLLPVMREALRDGFDDWVAASRHRAATYLRVNAAQTTRDAAADLLGREGIVTKPHPQVATALRVTDRAHALSASRTYAEGLVELQDAHSQAAVARLPRAGRVLDLCAGAGGKALAYAAREGGRVVATDAEPGRMADLPARARRAGAEVIVDHAPAAGAFDLVICDVPCSGSGTWRRDPMGKWSLTPDGLAALNSTQDAILARGASLTARGGAVALMTCSVLPVEGEARRDAFLAAHPGWRDEQTVRWPMGPLGDGFFLSVLRRRDGR